ncbi:FecR family protein [Rhodoligotrophos defluvii]|uniref:FecR family protein n=1 Tax=Rhodoligotrophos defluvii TaxID=2561934 RepID=UPI0010C9AF06|nr:FecR domain-containing protein [Rhodoligotrophos defluvii]
MSRTPKVPKAARTAFALGLLLNTVSGAALDAYAQSSRVGVNAAVSGQVYVTGAADANKRKAQVREDVYRGDVVETLRQSALQILLVDETVFTVGQNCEITIDEFVYDPNAGSGKVAASIAKGAFRFMTGKIGTANPSAVSLRTPASTIGIRGTMGEVAVGPDAVAICKAAGIGSGVRFDPASASLVALRGPGRGRNSFDKMGRIVITGGGRSVEISEPGYAVCVPYEGAAPLGPFRLDANALAYFDTWLRSTPQGRGINPSDVRETGGALSDQNLFNEPTTDTDPLEQERDDAIQDSNVPPDPYGGGGGEPPPDPEPVVIPRPDEIEVPNRPDWEDIFFPEDPYGGGGEEPPPYGGEDPPPYGGGDYPYGSN